MRESILCYGFLLLILIVLLNVFILDNNNDASVFIRIFYAYGKLRDISVICNYYLKEPWHQKEGAAHYFLLLIKRRQNVMKSENFFLLGYFSINFPILDNLAAVQTKGGAAIHKQNVCVKIVNIMSGIKVRIFLNYQFTFFIDS